VIRFATQPSPIQIMTDQNQPENVECFKYFGSMITHDIRRKRKIISRIVMENVAFNK
jgi:hypothetical protein